MRRAVELSPSGAVLPQGVEILRNSSQEVCSMYSGSVNELVMRRRSSHRLKSCSNMEELRRPRGWSWNLKIAVPRPSRRHESRYESSSLRMLTAPQPSRARPVEFFPRRKQTFLFRSVPLDISGHSARLDADRPRGHCGEEARLSYPPLLPVWRFRKSRRCPSLIR